MKSFLSLKIIIIAILSLIASNCQKHNNILSYDEIEVYNVVFNKLQLYLYPVPPPPPEELRKMDSIQIDKYWTECYNRMRKNAHDVYIYFNNKSKFYIDNDTFANQYNILLNEPSAIKKIDSIAIFKCLKPFDNHILYIADENFKFDSDFNPKKRKSLISFSRLFMNGSIALIEGGFGFGPLAGQGTLFFLKKINGKWTIIHYQLT